MSYTLAEKTRALKKHSALDLALAVGKAVLQDITTDKIDQVILGNVLAAGQGMNLARQISVHLNIHWIVPLIPSI